MKQQKLLWIACILALAGIGIMSRLVEHTPNFAPITALALTAGYYLRSRWSVAVPLLAMFTSDAVIGFYTLPVMAVVYGCYALAWGLGRHAKTIGSLSRNTLASSFLYFFATNAAVWAFTGMYSKTVAGLSQALIMGLPFFKASFFSDVFYTAAFVLVAEGLMAWQSRKALQTSNA